MAFRGASRPSSFRGVEGVTGREESLVDGVDTLDDANPALSSDNGVKTSRNLGGGRFGALEAGTGDGSAGTGGTSEGGGDVKKFSAVMDLCRFGARSMRTL